jgi:carbon storage regulator
MLVLSRRRGETVQIGPDVTVTFLGTRGQVMKIGIDAPPLIRVLRGELCGGDAAKDRLGDGSVFGQAVVATD